MLLKWIDENLEEEITIAKIAKKSGYSASYLQYAFKKNTGITIFQYIRLRRVYKISVALTISNEKLIVIFERFGFNCRSNFTKLFIKFFDISPEKYRFLHDRKQFDRFFLSKISHLTLSNHITS